MTRPYIRADLVRFLTISLGSNREGRFQINKLWNLASRTVKYRPLNIDYEQSLLLSEVYRVIEKKSVKPNYLMLHSHKKKGKCSEEKMFVTKKRILGYRLWGEIFKARTRES